MVVVTIVERMSDENLNENRICWECVGEDFLRFQIRHSGSNAECTYCLRTANTLSIGEVADAVQAVIDQHFYRTPSEPSGMEYAMMKEGDYDWERDGDPITDVIEVYAKVDRAVAEDIQKVLRDRTYDFELAQMGEEQPFEEEAYYAETAVDVAESQAGWRHFEGVLKKNRDSLAERPKEPSRQFSKASRS